ncbi:MAG: 4Fe-4S dicluster domain-containing protein [Gemmatimonadaceae bacterium]|nr:4Fe-4S dicluster domain-containing protein [Gemmatimonadaceae bacterium]
MTLPLFGTPLDRAKEGLDRCVHCGFCLPACPTYLALEDENDSPRGRLVLMRALLDGALAPDDPVVGRHLDQCLGCRGCETACPSGVPYGHLLEATRETLAAHRGIPRIARVVLWVMARPWAFALMIGPARIARATGIARVLAHILPARLAFPFAMLASTARPARPRVAPRPPAPSTGERVATLRGCVMEGLFTEVNRATERTLAHNGYALVDAPGQRCCGALHLHAGDAATARALAKANIAAFEASGATSIAVNSAGCGALLKDYATLFANDPAWRARAQALSAKVRDATELLASRGPLPGRSAPQTVTYDAPCHLQHAQRVTTPPLSVLGAIDGLTHRPLPDSDQCCGSAGIYNLVEPEVSERVLTSKLARIKETGAPIVVTGNPGCLMQIGAGLILDGQPVVARHPIELLDASYGDAEAPG